MGSTIGGAVTGGRRVLWVSKGRSERSARRASAAGLQDAGSLSAAVEQSDLVLSVCPPEAAEETLQSVLDLGYRGLFAEMNAIAPAKTERLALLAKTAGLDYVDGGIIGSPVRKAGTTVAYLSGPRAEEVAVCFEGGPLEAIVLRGPLSAASAIKMCNASWSKISSAVLANVLALATETGVRDALEEQWAKHSPGVFERGLRGLRTNAPKAWRYVPEMDEIAATYEAAGLPTGFAEASADLYNRLASHKDEEDPPTADELIEELLRRPVGVGSGG